MTAGRETIEFHQELVQGLFPFFVAFAISVFTEHIDLIDEDDTRLISPHFLEKASDSCSTDPYILLHEVTAGNGVEGDVGLTS